MTAPLPILTRTYRTQWRGRRFFLLIFLLSAIFAGFLLWRYADESVSYYGAPGDIETRLREAGRSLWLQLAWLQTALALLIPPALSAGSIARERERGLLDGLMLAPLSPARIALEKWLATLAPLLILFAVLLPFDLVVITLGGQGALALGAGLGFQILLAMAGTALGLVCSAWARRAHLALRSAYGVVVLWILGSGGAAYLTGDSFLGPLIGGYKAPFYIRWIGHTNPLLGAYDVLMPDASGNYGASATLTLLGIVALSLWSATRALRRPLVEAPFIADTQAAAARKKRAQGAGVPENFEVPVVGALRFANPVLGREVRSKFRLRQPPVGVIVVEVVLALAVAYFYARTLWTAFTDPSVRSLIFWGVAMTGLIVTLISCAIMGANGFSREHEGGTWESIRLSMLRPREIVLGKAVGIALTCLLFSIPVWPLLLPCINWSVPWQVFGGSRGDVAISQLVALVVVWLASAIMTTMWGLWWGRRARKTSAASGASLGTSALWLIGVPIVFVIGDLSSAEFALMWLNPFGALIETSSYWFGNATAVGLPFAAFALLFSVAVGALLERDMKREFGAELRQNVGTHDNASP